MIKQTQSPKVIASYALPPQSSFTCPPCSVRLRKDNFPVRRTTYASILDPVPKIISFVENSDQLPLKSDSENDGDSGMRTFTLPTSCSRVVHIDVLSDNG